ncbi:hypothetical protein BDN70DRAFT_925623 [Pholiota conissans]|uniref:DUF6699 domain-containing protein n=1 Tax=Pholiota conissans TaxID=109636 RepID=A0A9P5YMN5_9AGAR|nr:hypothetical protein BDN70DRAFT_925623 [Pholiota conissans]
MSSTPQYTHKPGETVSKTNDTVATQTSVSNEDTLLYLRPLKGEHLTTDCRGYTPSPIMTNNDLFINDNVSRHRTPLASVPPALPRIIPVPLPRLSPHNLISTHTLLTHRLSLSPIHWNMSHPPTTAFLLSTLRAHTTAWLFEEGITPTVQSITIRIKGVPRPIVVFPTQTGHPIKIIDILDSVYRGMCEAAMGQEAVGPEIALLEPDRSLNLDSENAIDSNVIFQHYRGRVWWNGLSKCTVEDEVWILQRTERG